MTTQLQLVIMIMIIIIKLITHSTDCCTLFPVEPGYLYYYGVLGQFTHDISVTAHARRDIYRNFWYHASWNISHVMIYPVTPIDKRLYMGRNPTGGTVPKYLHKQRTRRLYTKTDCVTLFTLRWVTEIRRPSGQNAKEVVCTVTTGRTIS
jgi:hypothetical protein